jgi:hypothetical protein
MAGKITQAAEIDLTVKGGEKPKSLKAELREAREEAVRLSREFGAFSKEAIAAQKRLAEVKYEMEDFGHRVNALNPDKFSRIGTAAMAMGHGFSAAQGAAALFGAESENVQKQLARVQGAMALSQGLQGLGDAKQSLLALGSSIKGPVVKAFGSLRGAIISTGIGALVVALGLVIANFDDVKKAVSGLVNKVPGLGTVIKALGEAWDWVTEKLTAFTDAVGITDSKLDAHIKQMEKATKAATEQAEIDEALGKDTYAQRKKILEDELELLKLNKENEEKIAEKKHEIRMLDAKRTKQVADEKAQEEKKAQEAAKAAAEKAAQEWKQRADAATSAQKSVNQELRLIQMSERDRELEELKIWRDEQAKQLTAGGQKLDNLNKLFIEKERKLRAEWAEEDLKKTQDLAKKKLEIEKQRIQDQMELAAQEFSTQQTNTQNYFTQEKLALQQKLMDKQITREQYDAALQQQSVEFLQRQIQDARDYGNSTLDLETQLADAKIAMAQQEADKKKQIAERDIEVRRQLLQNALATAENVALLLTNNQKKQEKIQKGFALAQIAIDTAQAISSLMKASEANPTNSVTYGLAGVAQFAAGVVRITANVLKAKQLLTQGSGGGPAASGGGGGGSSAPAPPQFQQIGQDITVQKLGGGGASGGTGDTQKIPVVEYSDIRKVGRRVQVLEDASTL